MLRKQSAAGGQRPKFSARTRAWNCGWDRGPPPVRRNSFYQPLQRFPPMENAFWSWTTTRVIVEMEERLGLLDRRSGETFRSQRDLGGAPSSVGGNTAGRGATAGARGPDRPSDRDALCGAGGAGQHGTVPANGARLRSTTLDHAPSRGILQRLARRQRARARTDSRATWTVSEDATATAATTGPNAGKRVEQDHRDRTTRSSADGISARQ